MPGYMEDVPDDEPMVMVKVIWFVRVVDISLNGIKIPEIYIIAEIIIHLITTVLLKNIYSVLFRDIEIH